jgi:FkbM family methyltransferase
VLTSYISLCQAEISGVWLIKDSDPSSRAKSQERSDVKIKFDGPRFVQCRRRISEFYREIEETLQNLDQRALLVWYKDLHDPETVKKISEFLGCAPPEKIKKPKLLVKQNLSAPHERVINVQEMVEFLDLHNCKSTVVENARNSLMHGDNNILSINGITINPESPAISPAMRKRIRSQKYEVQEARCVAALMEPGEVVLELGGGIGYISSLVGKTQKAQKIVVVEANPETIPIIKETHKLNNVDAEVLNGVAMPSCEKQCSIPFYIRSDFWASSLSPEPWAYSREVAVPCIDFNKLITDYKPSLVICDIEGGERNLFCALEYLPSVNKIIIEVHENIYGRKGVKELFAIFFEMGFSYDPSLSEKSVVVFQKI